MNEPLPLFSEDIPIPERIGNAVVQVNETNQILARANGFVDEYDYTLNPYVGCQFGCAYCYAVFFVPDEQKRESWGDWVGVKHKAVELLLKKKNLRGKKIYMSSVTDPYQPLEGKIQLTRRILEVLSEEKRQPSLIVQTRSPLVARDIDILARFKHLRVNMTITTDSDDVRKRFEPNCPSIQRRMDTVAELKRGGIKTGVCITPMLPVLDAQSFGESLLSLQADVYVAQDFHASSGQFAANTRQMAKDFLVEYSWDYRKYKETFLTLNRILPHLYEGKEGFMPE